MMKKSTLIIGLITAITSAPLWANTTSGLYEDYVIAGKTVYISGNIAVQNGEIQYPGKIGKTLSVEDGQKAAVIAAKNLLNSLQKAAGSFENVEKCTKVTAFVNAAADFTDHKSISNAASETIIAALGDKGRHARTTVGVSSLPLNAAVEIEAICTLN
jgi:enamine deaminase RidA (YjgF/YER057c/UK114 family)